MVRAERLGEGDLDWAELAQYDCALIGEGKVDDRGVITISVPHPGQGVVRVL